MLYPVIFYFFQSWNIPLEVTSIFLLLLGVQWYILFNVLSGALLMPQSLREVTNFLNLSYREKWKSLYLPSVLPSLVLGWLTAAGGAWNASLVTEFLEFSDTVSTVSGIGADLRAALASGDQESFILSLFVLIILIVFLNRFFWGRLLQLTRTRYRLD